VRGGFKWGAYKLEQSSKAEGQQGLTQCKIVLKGNRSDPYDLDGRGHLCATMGGDNNN